MSTPVVGGATNVVRYFQLRLAVDGTAATGLTITGIDMQYTRSLAAATTKVDAIVGTGGATTHVDNKVFEINATSSPGLYMACFPDAAFAAGVPEVILTLKEATIFSTSLAVPIDPVVGSVTGAVGSVTGAVGSVTGNVGGDVVGNVDGTVATLTTYTGNTLQTGDVITAINDLANATDGLTALKAAIDLQATLAICTETRLAELDAGNLPTDIAAIPTTAMRGTDSAALASVCTEGRLAELDAGNLPTDIAAIPTTAMRGTDSAALASVCTEGRLAELDAGNLPTDIAAIPTTAMRGTDSAATAANLAIAQADLDIITGASGVNLLTATQASIDVIETDTTTDIPALIATAQADLDTITGTAGALLATGQTATAWSALEATAASMKEGTAKAGTLTTTTMSTTLTEVDNVYNDQTLIFKADTTTAALRLQKATISDYANTNGVLTFSAVTTAPSATETFVIV